MTVPNDHRDDDTKRTIGTQTGDNADGSASEEESELEKHLKKRIVELKKKVEEVRETLGIMQQKHICPNALLGPNFHNETVNIKQEAIPSCSHAPPHPGCDSRNTESVNIKQESNPSGCFQDPPCPNFHSRNAEPINIKQEPISSCSCHAPSYSNYRSGNTESLNIQEEPIPSCSSHVPSCPNYRSGNTESVNVQEEPIPSCSSHLPSCPYYRSITTESENIQQDPIPSSSYAPSCSNFRSSYTETNDVTGENTATERPVLSDDERVRASDEEDESDVPEYNMHPPDTAMTLIGLGNARVPTRVLRGLDPRSYSVATRKLLAAVFPRRILATHSLSGKKSPAFPDKPAKQRLNRALVNDIIDTVTRLCNISEKYVRLAITTKCSDETRLLRKRRLNQRDRRRSFNADDRNESTSSSDESPL